jgi:hypothetical protein
MTRLVLIVEVQNATTLAEARAQLDWFREAVVPSQNYGLTFYQATNDDGVPALLEAQTQRAGPCSKCGGAGWVYQPGPTGSGGPITCPRCNGVKS